MGEQSEIADAANCSSVQQKVRVADRGGILRWACK